MPRARLAALVAVTLLASGCSLTRVPDHPATPPGPPPVGIDPPVSVPAPTDGERLLGLAVQFVGAPYRPGGSSPEGFDCSGLVVHAHQLAGLAVPRTAFEQHAASRVVPESALQPGDLVFFASRRGRVDHVGIYAGDGRFVHAPRRGRPVGYDRLDDRWFQTRFVGAGRFWTVPRSPGAAASAP